MSKGFKHFLSFDIKIKEQWNVSFSLNISRRNIKMDILYIKNPMIQSYS